MSNNKTVKRKILIFWAPFAVGFCGIIILQLFLIQNGKIPRFIVLKAQQQYLFKTSGAIVSYYYALPDKKKVTKEDIELVIESINKHSHELSKVYITTP